jgi:UDP-N-acetylmuramoylalanine--D-glutamate ligase
MIKEAMDKAGYTSYSEHADLEECVNKAYEMSVPGDKVLLSPACASWDMYPNFEVRGRHFKECVNKLQQK